MSYRVSRRRFLVRAAAAGGLLSPLPARLAGAAARTSLPTRPFGRTGVEVTLVGLGGGSRFYEPVKDDEQGAELVRQAIDRGIGFVETSANYGDAGESERRIGLAMRTHRERVFLETKVDARDRDGTLREVERSLRRLQTDRLDLVLHHYLEDQSQLAAAAGPKGAEAALRKLVEEKVVRFRGFSCHLPDLTLAAIDALEPDAIQAPITAVRVPDFEREVLPLTASRGIAVIAMKTCGHGYFRPEYTTKPDRVEEYGPPRGVLDRPGLPSFREHLHYALTLPVATAVVGIDSLPTIEGVVANAASFAPLAREAMDSITSRAQVFATTGYWIPGRS